MTKPYPIIGVTAYEKVVSYHPIFRMAGAHEDYKNALITAGGVPVLIPQNLNEAQLSALLDRLDGVLLPGGGDIDPQRYSRDVHPKVRGVDTVRDAMEHRVARLAVERDIPLLAICRGHQMLNVALGGTLWQDVETEMPGAGEHDFYRTGWERDFLAHQVLIEPHSRLRVLLGAQQTPVNSLHHQGVRDLAPGLAPVAYAEDGLIEALEMPDRRFVVSVQWHPENLVRTMPAMFGLFEGLVQAAAAYGDGS